MQTTHSNLTGYAVLAQNTADDTGACPPAVFEYTWYVLLAYATLGQAWGVVVESVGGVLLALLAAVCILSLGPYALNVYAPAGFALCTGVSVMAVQFFLYGSRSVAVSMVFIGWLLTVIIVQALALRPGFFHRFALAATAIGLGALPYMQLQAGAGIMRARASGTGISNSNSLGMWFGFCTIYFLFWSIQSKNVLLRTCAWVGMLGSLYVVTLTVSRGPLIGIALAAVVGFRSALKHHFVPVLSLVLMIWLVYESGAFQQTIDHYYARGAEESGRGKVWPLALQRIFDSPWTGVGLEAVSTTTAWKRAITPHNGLLYIALGAGIIPLMCFLGYLAQAGTGALRIIRRVHVGQAALLPPLVVFALFEVMILDLAFMSSWVVVVFALAAVKQASVRET